ncbi:recombinase family protein [Planktothrix pseudagardhii]|uniref:recombinase family protein n=1 Tax=Planktothrix pseudagardhii TaxID=132604 RepID=UPI0020B3C26D|nr:recombinase family protein [Planktothrix pseudagardhii]
MAVLSPALWITGGSRSGKTTRLIELFCEWTPVLGTRPNPQRGKKKTEKSRLKLQLTGTTTLIFAANSDNRMVLAERLTTTPQGQYSFYSTTPLGFFQDEVILFWPLLVEKLGLKAQFPLRLRPETEQELALQLWSRDLEIHSLERPGISVNRRVRQVLDLLQLAALSRTSIEDIPQILQQGFDSRRQTIETLNQQIGFWLKQWQNWCLERGLLTYGIIADLYGQHLLHHPIYQKHLLRRYPVVLADDVDEYPALARHLFEFFLEQGKMAAFTYNPKGAVRLGLGADPNDLASLQSRCRVETLDSPRGLGKYLAQPILELVFENAIAFPDSLLFSPYIKSIQTLSRADLLRQTAEQIIAGVKTGQVQPDEIAVIAPGLDAIARYTLRELLNHAGITVESMQEQRPLVSSPLVRALLTLMALIYPGNGRLVHRDAIAEMLVTLSYEGNREQGTGNRELSTPVIDPVRAGLLADHCFVPDWENPRLLPVTAFPRWDRLGYQATQAYQQILHWIEVQQQQYQQRLLASPVVLLDRGIQQFLIHDSSLRPDQLSVLRELMETAIHYWEVQNRLQLQTGVTPSEQVGQFIQLLRLGVVSANPYPISSLGIKPGGVTLGTIFQYRASRASHRWHFWLDVGSPLWLSGGASILWGAPLFLREREHRPWTVEEGLEADLQRLRRIIVDLLSRVSDRLILCHSDLAVNGQEQLGPLYQLSVISNQDYY